MAEIIDSHAHLAWESFQDDQEDVIRRALEKGVAQIVHAGVDLSNREEMARLARQHESIYISFGLHPHEASTWSPRLEDELAEALAGSKVVAVGECGLDYYYNHSDREAQRRAFAAQVQMACQLDLPLIVHSRDAWEDTFSILKTYGQGLVRGVFHCFTGGPAQLPEIEALDFYVSFSGIVTFKNAADIQAAARLVKADRLLVETDCPYLAPVPYRGKRNEPAYVWLVAQKVAEIRQVALDDLARTTTENARRLFRLPVPR